MALPISVTYTFATATSAIPLSQLDANFTTVVNGINGIGNGTNALANVLITGGTIDNVAIGTTTSSTGRFSTITATTGNITTINATTLNAATHRSDTTLTFQSNVSTTAMTIDASQRVGIGTASPTSPLAVVSNSSAACIRVAGRSSDQIGTIEYTNNAQSSTQAYIQSGANYLVFASGTTEAMRIDSSGNVGIGTSSPTGFGGTGLNIYNASSYGVLLVQGGTNIIEILANSSNGTAAIGTRSNTSLSLSTNDTERARIDSSGNLLVGTASIGGSGGVSILPNYQGANTPGALMTNKTASGTYNAYLFRYNGSNVGSITYSDSATSYNTSSDYRLKHDVQPMTSGLATIAALKPVTYKWNVDSSQGQGFLAHELQEVIPHAVTGEKDAVNEDGSIKPQGVDYSKIVVHLVAAIQELKAEIDALKGTTA